jgi:diguanylate cyclase (GGDEF)-like protein/PAS domain S-box-containing protein
MTTGRTCGPAPEEYETARLAALRRYAILGSEPEATFDDLAMVAARACRAPIALINFIDDRRQWTKASLGLNLRETALAESICKDAISHDGVFVVPDAHEDDRYAEFPVVKGDPFIRFYAAASLKTSEGLSLGTLCILDHAPRGGGLDAAESEALEAIARAVMRELDLRLHTRFCHLALDSMDQGVIVAEPDGCLPLVSKRAASFLARRARALSAQTGERRQNENDWCDVLEQELRDLTGKSASCAKRVVSEWTHPDGTTVEVRTVPGPSGGHVRTFLDITKRRQAEAAIREREARYRALADALPQNVWVTDLDGVAVYTNKAMRSYHGSPAETFAERLALFHPADRAAISEARAAAGAAVEKFAVDGRARRHDGAYRWHRITMFPMHQDDLHIGWFGVSLDVHDIREGEAALREQKALLRATLENMDQGLLMVDADGMVRVFNQRMIDLLGLPQDLVSSKPRFQDIVAFQEETGEIPREWSKTRKGIFRGPLLYERERPNGMVLEIRTVHLPGGGAVRTYTDISAHRTAERRMADLARRDAVTGLPNRLALQEHLEAGMRDLPSGVRLGMLLLDLDNFKDINDTLGHDAGDFVLKTVAARLQACLPGNARAMRFGGDEFAIVVSGVPDAAPLERLADQVMQALRKPMCYQQREVGRRTSIGIALCPEHGTTPRDLTKNADIALYAAKRAGRDQASVYSHGMGDLAKRRARVLRNARSALALDSIMPFYQPKIALSSGAIAGFEALLRWQHPKGVLRSPGELQEAFDDPELGIRIGQRMLQRVIDDMQGWKENGWSFGSVAVNLANAEFTVDGFADTVLSMLAAAGLGPECLEVEVTETVFLGAGVKRVGAALQTFHEGGVAVALDDFGTGFASLSHLNQFPLSWLKIDRSFVQGIGPDPKAAAIVHGVLSLARSLNIGVVAEGIETQTQLEFLRRRECELGQGFYFAKPMMGSQVPDFLNSRESDQPAKHEHQARLRRN